MDKLKIKHTKIISLILAMAFIMLPVHAMALTKAELLRQQQYYAAQAEAARVAAAKKAQEAAQVKQQISTIDGQISQIEQDINSTSSQITETENKITELEANIKVQEDNLTKQKDKMHQVVTSWYMEGDNGGLFEAVLGSGSLSEVTTKEQYYESIRLEISSVMDRITNLKNELKTQKDEQAKKKSDLDNMQAQQVASKSSIESRKVVKGQILSMTQSQQSQYLADASKYENEVSRVTDELRKLRQNNSKTNGETVVVSGSGGYSVNSSPCGSYSCDPWLFVVRQCTSYAAWYWNMRLGKDWENTRPGSGSAWNWPALASDQGYSVSSTPRVGAIITWGKMSASPTYGHVAIVEAVHGDGRIDISEYNWSISEGFDTRLNVDPGYWGSYNYIY